jgi:hypothetical protein
MANEQRLDPNPDAAEFCSAESSQSQAALLLLE